MGLAACQRCIYLFITLTGVVLAGFLYSSSVSSYAPILNSATARVARVVLAMSNRSVGNENAATVARKESSSPHLSAAKSTSPTGVKRCPRIPPNLVKRMKVVTKPPPLEDQEKIFAHLMPGGRYAPRECKSRHRVAIIIPYRNRSEHLLVFLNHMHHMLKRQQLNYGIYVVEQAGGDPFNRGKLFNIGYLTASRLYDFQCFIFHDVDLIPEDDRNLYTCPDQPRHVTVAISKFWYRLPYPTSFGGGIALSKRQVEDINGFSNEYWGWGAEDDDVACRVLCHKYKITRYPSNIARYTTLSHKEAVPSPARWKLLNESRTRFKTDGINSVNYAIIDMVFTKLYTWILADLRYKKPLPSQSLSLNAQNLKSEGGVKVADPGPFLSFV